jgi:hypothetical protein
MVSSSGAVYRKEHFERAQAEEVLRSYQLEPEMKVIVAADLFLRALAGARRSNTVADYIKRLERIAREEIHKFPELRDEVYAQLRKGPGRAKDFLYPRNGMPLQRVKRRCVEAIAEYRAWERVSKK